MPPGLRYQGPALIPCSRASAAYRGKRPSTFATQPATVISVRLNPLAQLADLISNDWHKLRKHGAKLINAQTLDFADARPVESAEKSAPKTNDAWRNPAHPRTDGAMVRADCRAGASWAQ